MKILSVFSLMFIMGAAAFENPAASNQTQPVIAFGENEFLVVWQESNQTGENALCARRANLHGIFPDTQEIAVSPPGANAFLLEAFHANNEYSVLWADLNGNTTHAVAISHAGIVGKQTENLFTVSSVPHLISKGELAVASDGTNFLFAKLIYVPSSLVSQSGSVINTFQIGGLDCSSKLTAIFSGNEYLLAWNNYG